MNERLKILELVQEGKLTPEQADLLLAALEEKSTPHKSARAAGERPFRLRFDRKFPDLDLSDLKELKHLGAQVKMSVAQAMKEARRTLEQQIGEWAHGAAEVHVRREFTVPASVLHLTLETKNGSVHVFGTDEPAARITVRGRVQAERLDTAEEVLTRHIQVNESSTAWQLTVLSGREEVEGAHLDVWLPRQLGHLFVHTKLGSIQLEHCRLEEANLETHVGNILLHDVDAERIRLTSHTGTLNVQNGIQARCRSAYLRTMHGGITVFGIHPDVPLIGSARTSLGSVDVQGGGIQAEYDPPEQRKSARFHTVHDPVADTAASASLFCETRNGNVSIRTGR